MEPVGVRIMLVKLTSSERCFFVSLLIGFSLIFLLELTVPLAIYREVTAMKDTIYNPGLAPKTPGNDSGLIFVLGIRQNRTDDISNAVSWIGIFAFLSVVMLMMWNKLKTMMVLSYIGIYPLRHSLLGNLKTKDLVEGLRKARVQPVPHHISPDPMVHL
ncbi:unnamed protein product [Nezara viridula]|uniref:Uncharacterized protein n=1 Tax=Nezara viridula TaxID=85310 RepID=A0A9P0HL90_NEZVI|nr:unnamed protein product [Nezara viridula]